MNTFLLDQDITVLYIKATQFPDGIPEAFARLHTLVSSHDRIFFGISAPDRTGEIQYKAAAEELIPGEAQKNHLDTFVIKKGVYSTITISDFRNSPIKISEAFQTLLRLPTLDPLGECIEWYLNPQEVRCMVRLVNQ